MSVGFTVCGRLDGSTSSYTNNNSGYVTCGCLDGSTSGCINSNSVYQSVVTTYKTNNNFWKISESGNILDSIIEPKTFFAKLEDEISNWHGRLYANL